MYVTHGDNNTPSRSYYYYTMIDDDDLQRNKIGLRYFLLLPVGR
jgi:hypothetical protein